MKYFIFAMAILGFTFGSSLAIAETDARISEHNVSAGLGFAKGGFTLQGEYEYEFDSNLGLGAYGRFAAKDSGKGHDGYLAVGGFVRPHFTKKAWDFYLSPGFGIVSIDAAAANAKNETVLGPALAFGLNYQITRSIAVGMVNTKYYGWFADNYKGLLADDFLVQGRMSF